MEYQPTDIAAQERARSDSRERSRQAREVEKDDFRWLMQDKRGRRFVWRLLETAGVFRTTFRTSSEMAFLEGQRNMGLVLIAEINELCPEQYAVMLNEARANGRRNTD